MIKVSCYKTIQEKLPRAFCMLAEKCYHNGIKIFVYTNSNEYTVELDKVLWTYSKKQFIPHGTNSMTISTIFNPSFEIITSWFFIISKS